MEVKRINNNQESYVDTVSKPKQDISEYIDTSVFLDNITDEAKRNLLRNSTREVTTIMEENAQNTIDIASSTAAITGGAAVGSAAIATGIVAKNITSFGIIGALGAKSSGLCLFGPAGIVLAAIIVIGGGVAIYALKKQEDAFQDKKAITNFKNKLDENYKKDAPTREGLTGTIAGKLFSSEEKDAIYHLPSQNMIEKATAKLPNKGLGHHYFITTSNGAVRPNSDVEYSIVELDLNKYIGKSIDRARDIRNISPIDHQAGFKVEERNIKMSYVPVIQEFANLSKNRIELGLQDKVKHAAFKELLSVCTAEDGTLAVKKYDQNMDGKLDHSDLKNIIMDINGDNVIDDKDKGLLGQLINARKQLKDACNALGSTL